MSDVVALIPARAGSKRITGKNLRRLNGHPVIAYTIAAAARSGAFSSLIVSTDDPLTASVARHYGAEVPQLRPSEMAEDLSPDIQWVRHALGLLHADGRRPAAFAILRPTSPLRRPETVSAAVTCLLGDPEADSLRAVERVKQHPGKMWVMDEGGVRMRPLLDDGGAQPPWHSRPYQDLPEVYVQNASLEVAWVRTVVETGSIAGRVVRPWVSEGLDGFDLNDESDWLILEHLVAGGAPLPDPGAAAWTGAPSMETTN